MLRITSLSEANDISELLEILDLHMPKPKAKPPVFRYKPRNPRRPKHARRGD